MYVHIYYLCNDKTFHSKNLLVLWYILRNIAVFYRASPPNYCHVDRIGFNFGRYIHLLFVINLINKL